MEASVAHLSEQPDVTAAAAAVLQVAGQSAQVLDHSRSFSSVLGQLMDLSVADLSEQPKITRLQAMQQTYLKAAAKAAAEKAAAERAAAKAAAAAAAGGGEVKGDT